MKIYYREKSGGIEILRCYGIAPRVEIPEMINEKIVISAAPYAFSCHMDENEELKNSSVWEFKDGFGFGREVRRCSCGKWQSCSGKNSKQRAA